MQSHKDIAHFLSFIGFGCVCFLACCMGVYGFMVQETSARLQAYSEVAAMEQNALSEKDTLRLAANFKGLERLDTLQNYKSFDLKQRSDLARP